MSLIGEAALALEEIQIGSEPPPFELLTLGGDHISLKSLLGKSRVLVIVFWATWNPNSLNELERLQELLKEVDRSAFRAVAINVEGQSLSAKELQAIEKVRKSLSLTMPILLDEGLKVFARYGVVAVPSTLILDDKGRTVFRLAGYPLLGREEAFTLMAAMARGRPLPKPLEPAAYQPNPKAVRYYNLARTMGEKGFREVEEGHLKRSMEADSRYLLPLVRLSRLYLTQGRLGDARQLLARGLDLIPGNEVIPALLGYLSLLEGDAVKGEEFLRKALEREPNSSTSLAHMGLVLVRQKKMQEAFQALTLARELSPGDYRVYLSTARAYDEAGMVKEAALNYRKAAELLGSF